MRNSNMTVVSENNLLLIATDNGLIVGPIDGRSWRKTLIGKVVSAVIAREGVILAGTEDGVWRSDDQGQTWRDCSTGLPDRNILWLAFHPQISDFELVGTASGGILISRDGGASWHPLTDDIPWAEPLRAVGTIKGVFTNAEAIKITAQT